jgi:hypothetical protein
VLEAREGVIIANEALEVYDGRGKRAGGVKREWEGWERWERAFDSPVMTAAGARDG